MGRYNISIMKIIVPLVFVAFCACSSNAPIGEKTDNKPQNENADVLSSPKPQTVAAGTAVMACIHDDGTVSVAHSPAGLDDIDASSWTDITSIAISEFHLVGLKSDGTVVATGDNNKGQLDVEDWKDIVSIDVGSFSTIATTSDGRVLVAGDNDFGSLNVSEFTNVLKAETTGFDTYALLKDRTVAASSSYKINKSFDYDLNGPLVDISAGIGYVIGLNSDGRVFDLGTDTNDFEKWENIIQISTGASHAVGLRADGTVVSKFTGDMKYDKGQCMTSNWQNIKAVFAGEYNTIGVKSDGTLELTGLYTFSEDEVKGWNHIKIPN